MNIRTLGLSAVLVLCLAGGSHLFSETIIFEDDFEGTPNPLWTTENTPGYADSDGDWVVDPYSTNWELGPPTYSGFGNLAPTSAYSGTNIYGTDLDDNYAPFQTVGVDVDNPPDPILALRLITPLLDLTEHPYTDATLTFVDWLQVHGATQGLPLEDDYVALEVLDASDTHLGWLPVGSTFENAKIKRLDTTWQTGNSFSLDNYVGQTIKIAFNVYVNEYWEKTGWHIDDVKVSSTYTPPVPEPATLLLLSSAACVLLRRRRS